MATTLAALEEFMTAHALPEEVGGHVGAFMVGYLHRISGSYARAAWAGMVGQAAGILVRQELVSPIGPGAPPEPVFLMAVFLAAGHAG